MNQGRIEEEGTYEELIAKQGAFHALIMHQTMDTEAEDTSSNLIDPGPHNDTVLPSKVAPTKTIDEDDDKASHVSLKELEDGLESQKTILPRSVRSFFNILWQERSWITLGIFGSLCLYVVIFVFTARIVS
jgi:hypothetical protein